MFPYTFKCFLFKLTHVIYSIVSQIEENNSKTKIHKKSEMYTPELTDIL